MPLSIRERALQRLHQDIATDGIVYLSRRERAAALQAVTDRRDDYEIARELVLRHQLGRFFRVAIFGSARLKKGDPEFDFVVNLSRDLVVAIDPDIVSGGGPGIMWAAHMGSNEGKAIRESRGLKTHSRNVGITLRTLPNQPKPHPDLHFDFSHGEFSTRIEEFGDQSQVSIFAAGGEGTLLEMQNGIQLRQVGHLEPTYPLIATNYWRALLEAKYRTFYYNREITGQRTMVDREHLGIVQLSDDIGEIVEIVSTAHTIWKRDIRDHIRVGR